MSDGPPSISAATSGTGDSYDNRSNSEVRVTAAGLSFVRTPEECFAGLVDFDYEPRYVEVAGLRMAYVADDGRPDHDPAGPDHGNAGPSVGGSTILLLHGEPTWSYLYRRMIPVLVAAGHRVIAPDLIGFGRSDKPTERSVYSYAGHVAWLRSFLDALEPELELAGGPLHMFGQDWGGLIGLRLAAQDPDRFDRLILANTTLPEGQSPGAGFEFWLQFSQEIDFLDCGRLVANTAATDLSEAVQDAYRAPFPSEVHMAGARQFPVLVPISLDDPAVEANRAAWEVLEQWTKPVLTLWAPGDPVLGNMQSLFTERIPGAQGQPHALFEPAGHFIQEDQGPAVAAAMASWLADS